MEQKEKKKKKVKKKKKKKKSRIFANFREYSRNSRKFAKMREYSENYSWAGLYDCYLTTNVPWGYCLIRFNFVFVLLC